LGKLSPMVEYDSLVFPQVEELPREWPVIIPLGGEPDDHRSLIPSESILMPAIPYGFAAPLELELEPVVSSLCQILREDGFDRIQLLGPRGYGDLPRIEANFPTLSLARESAVIPLGHTEQHGFHLPLSTDTLIVQALASQLKGGPRLTVLPAWPYGVSTHRRQYPGTLSLDARVFEDFLVSVAGALSAVHSVIYFLNGHGGNHSFLVNVCKFAGEQFPQTLTATTFLHTSSGKAEAELNRLRESRIMGHACELETSYVMYLRPELVRLDLAVDEAQFLESANYHMDWCGEGSLILNPPWSDDTRTGTYGIPSLASSAKGEAWLKAGGAQIELQLEELRQQWERRQQRRSEGWVEGAWRKFWPGSGQTRSTPNN